MSEHITHVAIFEDCNRLLQISKNDFPEPFSYCLNQQYDSGILCSGTRGNHTYAVPIVEKFKGTKKNDLSEEGLQQLAGALGWVSHRAADSTLNPLADQIDGLKNPMFNGQDLKLYYEVITMKKVYASGEKTTGSPFEFYSPATLSENMHANPAAKLVNIQPFETLYTNYFLREFLSLMSFTQVSAPENLDTYLDDLTQHAQYFQENLSLYTEAYERPDPLKLQEFDYHLNFYNENDKMIQLVRMLQNGTKCSEKELESALLTTESNCKYAQALKLNYEFWLYLGDFYDGKIERTTLEEKLGLK